MEPKDPNLRLPSSVDSFGFDGCFELPPESDTFLFERSKYAPKDKEPFKKT
jgi:hypothetical protein